MLYAYVKVIVLVWKIMKNTGFILDLLSALTRTPKQLLWSGKRHWIRTLFAWGLQKVQRTGRHSKEMEINRFLLWDTTDKEGEATSWPNEKHVFFWWKLVKVMRQRCHSKLTEHVAFLASRYEFFGELATSDLFTLMKSLNEAFVPRAVLSDSEVPVDSM